MLLRRSELLSNNFLKYVYGDATQYTLLDFIPKMSDKIKIIMKVMPLTSAYDVYYYGARNADQKHCFALHSSTSVLKWRHGHFYNTDSWVDSSTFTINTEYLIETYTASGSQYIKINGTSIYSATSTLNNNAGYNLTIGAFHNASTLPTVYCSMGRFYYMKIYFDGILKYDLQPMKKNEQNGFYNKISHEFFGAKVGNWLAGPKK